MLNAEGFRIESADTESGARISAWLEAKAGLVRQAWEVKPSAPPPERHLAREDRVEAILNVLVHHSFNHQSRGKVAHLLPSLRQGLAAAIEAGEPLVFFLLYNGGYRGSPVPGLPQLIFHPDQTEFMLLSQVALLQKKVSFVHRPGIEFVIVVNNGVSRWVNDIPRNQTEAYAARLRSMIGALGAERQLRVLVQSELPGYSDCWQGRSSTPRPAISEAQHRIVERFLGRSCSELEARDRIALYPAAEADWWETFKPIATARKAIILRQVAGPSSLSFRPFPGGAIRTQNGTVGFVLENDGVVPRLLTTTNSERYRGLRMQVPKVLRRAWGISELADV